MGGIKKLVLIFFFLFSCFTSIISQNPGYMGKRTTVGYGFYMNPALTAALIDYGTTIVNTQHEFFIERALKAGISLGFSYKLYKSTYNNTTETDMSSLYNPGSANNGITEVKPGGTTYIKASNYALYLKLYKRKYVAPWGKYFLLGLTLNTRECTYDPDEMYLTFQDYNPYGVGTYTFTFNDFGPTTQVFKYPDLMIGNGNSRIIGKHIVLDYGYNINVAALTMMVIDAFDEYQPYPEKYIQVNSGMRVRGINRFNLFFKIGYLF